MATQMHHAIDSLAYDPVRSGSIEQGSQFENTLRRFHHILQAVANERVEINVDKYSLRAHFTRSNYTIMIHMHNIHDARNMEDLARHTVEKMHHHCHKAESEKLNNPYLNRGVDVIPKELSGKIGSPANPLQIELQSRVNKWLGKR